MDTLRIVERILWALPELLMLFIAIRCMSRGPSTDAVLMLVGAILGIITSVASIVIWEFLFGSDVFDGYELIGRINSYIALASHMLFLVGVLLFAMKSTPPPRPY